MGNCYRFWKKIIQTGKYRIPHFMKLVFSWPDEDLERTLTLPIRASPSGIEEEPLLMKSNNKGSILVFGIGFNRSVVGFMYAFNGRNCSGVTYYVSQFHKRDDLRVHAHSALNLAIGVLNEFSTIEKTLYSPSQGWGDPLSYSGLNALDPSIKWSITLIDESRKASLNSMKEKIWFLYLH